MPVRVSSAALCSVLYVGVTSVYVCACFLLNAYKTGRTHTPLCVRIFLYMIFSLVILEAVQLLNLFPHGCCRDHQAAPGCRYVRNLSSPS
jgi:hypothetical protein